MEQQSQGGLPPNFNLNDARDMTCECGSKQFMPAYRFKKISRLLTGADRDTVLPIELYLCTGCGKSLQELLPEELREQKIIE